MSKESVALRMRELGLKTLQEWDFYKFMFNNVSFNNKDVESQSCEKVYAKFARGFTKYQDKNNIWKDPKVELPKSYELGAIGSDSIFIVIGIGHFAIVECIENKFVEIDYSCDMVIKDYTDYTITKWAYCKDLIKQAGGK